MPNRLAHSTSPYLQQHAGNPVDWREWGPDALAAARETGKPILLSVGYSACHWCHVMAHESFEDEKIAALMNALFINIKVDREERPDIDQIYQSAHALLAQSSGGWPLTMFLMPDTTPFFGGTYFPKTPRHGLPGFGDLLRRVEQLYRERQPEIREQNATLLAALQQTGTPPKSTEPSLPTAEAIGAARASIVASFDADDGGFGHAPKFPHPEMLDFCLRRFAATGDAGDAQMRHSACFTLERMCRGGIFDQLGGGFARYSTDSEWTIPHFEKMLYDNGPLLRLLADAWLVAESPGQKALFAECAAQTAGWGMREMQAAAGGYFSSLDADSEGHEGKFYVWTRNEVEALLTADEWRVAELAWGLDQRPNFEDAHWNLTNRLPLAMLSERTGQSEPVCGELIETARAKLFAARATRIHPGRDDKVLTSWNALMIEGMAHAARVFGRDDWHASARRALDFLRDTMWDPAARRLRATHKDGYTHLNAYLDDYAYLLKAIIEVAQTGFSGADLAFGRQIADVLLEQFEDADQGGFHFTSHDHESLILRPKPGFDNATPSGNGVAAFALQRLSHLTNDLRYATAAERTLACFSGSIARQEAGHCSLLMALEEWLEPTRMLILTGPCAALAQWQRQLAGLYLPSTIVVAIPDGTDEVPEPLRRPPAAVATAWLCQGVTCLPPMTEAAELVAALEENARRPGERVA